MTMSKTIELAVIVNVGISNIGDWILFEICFLSFGIFKFCQAITKTGHKVHLFIAPEQYRQIDEWMESNGLGLTFTQMTEGGY